MDIAWTVFEIYIVVFGAVVIGGILADRKHRQLADTLLASTKQRLLNCAMRFNQETKDMQKTFERESLSQKRQQNIFQQFGGTYSNRLRENYQQRYKANRSQFERDTQQIIDEWEQVAQKDNRWKHFWRNVIVTGVVVLIAACSHANFVSSVSVQHVSSPTGEARYWTAQELPMPHLTDGNRYVSNPDHVVSEETVARLDRQLKMLDDSLGIESVVAIVRHVADRDIFRFAQDIFDIYKVGKNDRGLVMVLAYDDHLFRTHTGRSLEGDLTDVECFRLQEKYLIPSMKEEMPDSGMIYMTEAVYNTLKGKELPEMALAKDESDSSDGTSLIFLYFILLFGWAGLYSYLSNRHGWNLRRYANNHLLPNPFDAVSAPLIISSGGGGRHGGFGGGFSGGGFSGGSSGGGGATSSW